MNVCRKKLFAFDFDETLVSTDSRVLLVKSDGTRKKLTTAEYAVYEPQPGDQFDYTDFRRLVRPIEIEEMTNVLRKIVAKRGSRSVIIITARGSDRPVKRFLRNIGTPDIEVVALDSNNPLDKSSEIARRIDDEGYDHVEFFDDSHKNVEAVQDLQEHYPDVKFRVRHIKYAENYKN